MRTNDENKKQLLAKYEAMLDEVLAKRKADDEITLDEIEALVGEAQEGMRVDMVSALPPRTTALSDLRRSDAVQRASTQTDCHLTR